MKKEQNSREEETQHSTMPNLAGKYLTFYIGEETYGLEILKVQEIIAMQEISKVPRTPEHVKGVFNLRGKVIPVVDLRLKFGMEEQERTRHTCIIIVNVQSGEKEICMGVIVDQVSEVAEIAADEIEPAPSFGNQVATNFIMGMTKTKDDVKILLDIDKVLTEGDFEALEGAARQ